VGRRSTVATSPLEPEIRELLVSGWSPERVYEYLVGQYGEEAVPSAKAMDRYRIRHIPPGDVLPGSMIKRALKGLRHRVDALKLLDDLIWAQEHRVARMWERERQTGEDDPKMDSALRTLLEYIRERYRLGQELGLTPSRSSRSRRQEREAQELPETHLQEIMAMLRHERDQDRAQTAGQVANE
jgi:hypothetical protein